MRMRPHIATTALSLLTLAHAGAETDDPVRPNILIVLGDDLTYTDLALYGGTNVKTPEIDGLASEGLTFDRAFVGMSICTPCRAELYTGLEAMSNGVRWNHGGAHPGTASIVKYFGDEGYRVGIAGKSDVRPSSVFGFEHVPGIEGNCVSDTANFHENGIHEFFTRDNDQPFCLAIGLTSPHAPWTVGDASHFDPKTLELPANLADTPQTRKDFARYLAEVEVLDQQVGQVLDALEKSGKADNTIVVFSSEQGAQFPGAKWTNWNAGIHTGLVVRWPGKVKAGLRTQALVQYADILPTLLEASDAATPSDSFDGTSFLDVLTGENHSHRAHAFAMHNNVPEGPPYPIRSVTDGRMHYIRNLTPDSIYIERHLMGRSVHNAYFATWMFQSPENDRAFALLQRFIMRPAEELYDLETDPNEMTNLASNPAHASDLARMRGLVTDWMQKHDDAGVEVDTRDAYEQSRREWSQTGN